jgi:hypothetical protein
MRDSHRVRDERKWDRRSMEDDMPNPVMPSRRYQESAYT